MSSLLDVQVWGFRKELFIQYTELDVSAAPSCAEGPELSRSYSKAVLGCQEELVKK